MLFLHRNRYWNILLEYIAILVVQYEISVPDVFETTPMSLFFLSHSPLIDAFNTIVAERLSIAN